MRITVLSLAFSALATSALAVCPFGELARRGLADAELSERYFRGEGMGDPHEDAMKKRKDDPKAPGSGPDDPPLLDPVSGILSGLGLGGLVPRDDRHSSTLHDHMRRRLDEREEEVDIDAAVLTPKAHKRHFKERGLIGGILAPLSGALQFLDIPTPQESGLKAIPGNDPKHQYQAPGANDVRGDCPTYVVVWCLYR